ncbi:MAG: hypothetical protein RRY07_01800 [Bacteroidaceae bacterium]
MNRLSFLIISAISLMLCSCGNNKQASEEKHEPTSIQQSLLNNDWTFSTPSEGEMPESYGIKNEYGIQDNYFDITMGTDYDLVVRIINIQNKNCIRYVFVPNNTTVTVQDIPQGEYVLKLSYGTEWMENTTDPITKGKFTENTTYEQVRSIFDFGRKNSQSVVSYKLEIQVENNVLTKSFETDEISEKRFFEDSNI